MRSKRKTGPSLQTKSGPNWQWPHRPMAHFMLRSIDRQIRSIATRRVAQARRCKAHHDLRAADQRDRMRRIERYARDQCAGTTADIAAPGCRGVIDGDLDIHVETSPPALELTPVEEVSRAARAVRAGRPGHNARAVPARRRSPAAAERDQGRRRRSRHRCPRASAIGQRDAVRTAHPDVARRDAAGDRAADRADVAHGMDDAVACGGIAADR